MRWIFYHPSFWSIFVSIPLDRWSVITWCLHSGMRVVQRRVSTASSAPIAFIDALHSRRTLLCLWLLVMIFLLLFYSLLVIFRIYYGNLSAMGAQVLSLVDSNPFLIFASLRSCVVYLWMQLRSVHGCLSLTNVKLWRWILWSSMCVGFASRIFLKVCSGSCLLILWSL